MLIGQWYWDSHWIPCLFSLPPFGIGFSKDCCHYLWNSFGCKPVRRKIIHIPSFWVMIKCSSFSHTIINIFLVRSSPLWIQRHIHYEPHSSLPFFVTSGQHFVVSFLVMSQSHSCLSHLRLTDLPVGWEKFTAEMFERMCTQVKGYVINM